ncbi:hypothetical protein [Ideonella paludis]|uniref:Lysozyme inhibitor LprI N-terminal domain-containing protein n=1 Tax=Ideonella paludis TaxID=1233411 RepID=A0ABS5DVS2_9BURK|nr:hypothetical protein [Ideonella paludis]MBQ0935255.1 hypothetical protein [Ideonella paludis]
MRKILLSIALLWLGLGLAAPAAAQDCAAAERELWHKRFSNWEASHSYFKEYRGHCSDGALAEAISSIHTQLLLQDQRGVERLAGLAEQDPDYLKWVLQGVFYNPEETSVNGVNSACRLLIRLRACSPKHRLLCGKLAERVGPNPEYTAACPGR